MCKYKQIAELIIGCITIACSCTKSDKPDQIFRNNNLKNVIFQYYEDNVIDKTNCSVELIFCSPANYKGVRYDSLVVVRTRDVRYDIEGAHSIYVGYGIVDGARIDVSYSGYSIINAFVDSSLLKKDKEAIILSYKNRNINRPYQFYDISNKDSIKLLGISGVFDEGHRSRFPGKCLLFSQKDIKVFGDSTSFTVAGCLPGEETCIWGMRFFAEPKYSSRERIYSDIYISGLSDENELKYLFSGWIPKGSMGGYVESDDYLGKGIFDLCLYKDPSASAFIEHSRISMDAACTFVPILDYYNGWCLICIGDKKGWTRNMVEKRESIK